MNIQTCSRIHVTLLALGSVTALTACVYEAPEGADPGSAEEALSEDMKGSMPPDPVHSPGPLDPARVELPTNGPSPSLLVNRGMTWVKAYHTNATGQDTVGCYDYSANPQNPTSCNPSVGDTDCKEVRPILCIRQDGSASNGFVGSFYNGWAHGNIGLTHGVQGMALTSLAAADAACVKEFGANWRMAEHHDGGGGWNWTAYGNINDLYGQSDPSHTLQHRFWVYINDQPGAPGPLDGGNCWD